MKKLISLSFAALIALGAAVPIVQVAQADDPPEPINWYLSACPYGDCSNEPLGLWTVDYEGAYSGGGMGTGTYCTGAGCNEDFTFYYEITGEFFWEHFWDYGPRTLTVQVRIPNVGTWNHYFPCGQGLSGNCYFRLYGTIVDEVALGTKVELGISISPSPFGDDNGVIWHSEVSGTPINTDACDDYQDQEMIADGTLDPTDEDGDYIELVTGELYRVNVFGGPWNDGSNDRYDAAIKNGEEDWLPVAGAVQDDEYVQCVQNDEEDLNYVSFVIEAQDVDFRIRVNDIEGAFADNTGSLDYEVIGVIDQQTPPGCNDSFLITGTPIYSGTLAGNDSSGKLAFVKDIAGRPAVGDYLAVVITGAWYLNGAGSPKQDIQIKEGSAAWEEITLASNTICADIEYDIQANPITSYFYFQVATILPYYFRVDDDDGNFASNTGSVNYTVYQVRYSPPASGCGMDYALGDYLGKRSAAGNSASGVEFTFPFNNITANGSAAKPLIFAVETSKYFLDGGTQSVAGAVRKKMMNGLTAWEDLETFGDALCVETIDPLGHVRVYFAVNPWYPTYYFRAQDDLLIYSDNSGSLEFNFYQTTYLPVDDPPIGDPCGDAYQKGGLVKTYTIPATSPYIKLALTDGQYYAIETDGGPWFDNGAPSYFVGMASIAPGIGFGPLVVEYEMLEDFALCYQDAGEHYVTGFIFAQPGYDYYVRVYDELLGLPDNTGSIQVKVFTASNESNTWETCGDAYTISEIAGLDPAKMVVPGNQSSGARIEYITTGSFYALEISGTDYWYDADVTSSYLAAICEPGVSGCTEEKWIPLTESKKAGITECVVTVDTTKPTYRIYFNTTQPLKLRVLDTDGNFEENGGRLRYILYGGGINGNVTPPPGDNPVVPGWAVSCYTSCQAPDGLITTITVPFGTLGSVNLPIPNVGGWISYATCSIVSYLTWCPEHTDAIKNIGRSIAETREPMATLNDLIDLASAIKSDVDNIRPYSIQGSPLESNVNGIGGVNGDTIGDINGNPPTYLDINGNTYVELLTFRDNINGNPWFGGQLDLSVGDSEEDPGKAAEIVTCIASCSPIVGDGAASGICELHYMLRNSKFFVALILAMDSALVFFIVFKYLPGWVRRLINMINRNSSAARDIVGSL